MKLIQIQIDLFIIINYSIIRIPRTVWVKNKRGLGVAKLVFAIIKKVHASYFDRFWWLLQFFLREMLRKFFNLIWFIWMRKVEVAFTLSCDIIKRLDVFSLVVFLARVKIIQQWILKYKVVHIHLMVHHLVFFWFYFFNFSFRLVVYKVAILFIRVLFIKLFEMMSTQIFIINVFQRPYKSVLTLTELKSIFALFVKLLLLFVDHGLKSHLLLVKNHFLCVHLILSIHLGQYSFVPCYSDKLCWLSWHKVSKTNHP